MDALLPIVWSLSLAAIVFGAAFFAFRDGRRAGLLAALLMLLFLSYGRVLEVIDSPLVTSGRLLILWGVLGVLAVVGVWRLHRDLRVATVRLNAIAVLLLVIALVPAVVGEAGDSAGTATAPQPSIAPGEGTAGPERDIYVVIVEDIGSERILRDVWGMTGDSPFTLPASAGSPTATRTTARPRIHWRRCSTSTTSMKTAAAMGPDSGDYEPVYDLLDNPSSARFLEGARLRVRPHRVVVGPDGWSSIADVNMGLETLSDFATAWLETTMRGPRSRAASRGSASGSGWPGSRPTSSSTSPGSPGSPRSTRRWTGPGRTFVFAHFLIPHDPYAFNLDGSFVTDEQRADRSREQSFLDQSRYTMEQVEAFNRRPSRAPTRPTRS